jgi:adenine-specific DNA-methyltransferase
VSRLNDLLNQLRTKEPGLAQDLEREFAALADRRAFGLNFERHVPEAVELPGRKVRKGDKTRVLPSRDEMAERPSDRLWRVVAVDRGAGLASLEALDDPVEEDKEARIETSTVAVEDLVVVAEFRDPIYPGLASTGRIERGGDKPFHTVINAENFHALELMLFTHRARVDCIYIDPPYNTGAKDWKYNNDYIESDDLYRHSKWLAMMERRLLLAKELLRPDNSVLMVTIDENEVHRVGLLLEQVFPGSKVQMVTVLTNPAGASIIDQFSRVDEHIFFVHIGEARPGRTITDTTPGTSTFVTADGVSKPFVWESFLRSGGNSRRQDTKAKFFPVWIDPLNNQIIGCGDHLSEGLAREDAPPGPTGAVAQWPIKTDGSEACWQTSAPTFRQYLGEGRIKLGRINRKSHRYAISFLPKGMMRAISEGELVTEGRDEQGSLIVRNAEGRVRSQIGKTMWTNVAYSATEYGSTLLRKIIPSRRFPFPKSLYAVEDALRYYVGDKPEAVVVDFFAGSGTTTHAVMRLNRQDGGHRRSILVTNNEVAAEEQRELRSKGLRPGDPEWEQWGICEYITKPRIKAVVTGLTPDDDPIKGAYRIPDESPMADGFEENVEFLTLTYEAPLRVASNREFLKIAPLLWIRAGSRGRRIEDISEGWDVADTYGVLADLDLSEDFLETMAANDDVAIAYIVTDEERLFESIAQELPNHVESVRLYEAYLRNFEIESGRGAL